MSHGLRCKHIPFVSITHIPKFIAHTTIGELLGYNY